jgi:WD40 repeat protein
MLEVCWKLLGPRFVLLLGLGGCGGRVDQVNVGSEEKPRNVLSPTLSEDDEGTTTSGNTDDQQVTPLPACRPRGRAEQGFAVALWTGYSPDGSLRVTLRAGHPTQIHVFLTSDDSLLMTLEAQNASYYKASISPDNDLLAVAGWQSPEGELSRVALHVFSLKDGSLLADLPLSCGGYAVGVDFSNDGRLLATSGEWDPIEVWSVPDFQRHRSFERGTTTYSVRFSPDDARLVTGGYSALEMLDVAEGGLVWSKGLPMRDAMFSPDGTQLVSSGTDSSSTTKLWDATDGALLQDLNEGATNVRAGSVSFYDADHILTNDSLVGARVWERRSDGLFAPSCSLSADRSPPSGPTPNGVQSAVVAASPGGKQIAVAGAELWIFDQLP